MKSGETGWLHPLNQQHPEYKAPPRDNLPVVDCARMMDTWSTHTNSKQVEAFAKYIGVETWTIIALGAAWAKEHAAWAFPMKDGLGHIVGIRLRSITGKKWTVRGTHSGLFYSNTAESGTALIVEGPTDAAAGMSMGYFTIGRPSCSGGIEHIKDLVRRFAFFRVVIIADNDVDDHKNPDKINPGINGASLLARSLPVSNCIIVLPTKDLRQFVQFGGDRATLDTLITSSIWNK